MAKLIEVYEDAERFNAVCNATIPGAYMAVLELEDGTIVENAIGPDTMTRTEAKAEAIRIYC